ncbi:MAG: hypothetical protein AAFX46_00705 [Cyanobacteria bacterium J06636_27]
MKSLQANRYWRLKTVLREESGVFQLRKFWSEDAKTDAKKE